MLNFLSKKIFGSSNDRVIKKILPLVDKVNELEKTYEKLCTDLTCKRKYDIVGQEQHGVCAIAKNPWDAFEHIERLEHICQIVLASGNHLKSMTFPD